MFYLYGTSHCHLCEEAEVILNSFNSNESITWKPIDIAENDALSELYGLRIPVLKSKTTNKELCWPFDSAAARAFIDSNNC